MQTTPNPPTPRTFLDREIARSGHLIHKLKAKDSTGRWAYYFVYVAAAKERLFLEVLKRPETIDLEAYGIVVASCYGAEPTDEVKTLLLERYGFVV